MSYIDIAAEYLFVRIECIRLRHIVDCTHRTYSVSRSRCIFYFPEDFSIRIQ